MYALNCVNGPIANIVNIEECCSPSSEAHLTASVAQGYPRWELEKTEKAHFTKEKAALWQPSIVYQIQQGHTIGYLVTKWGMAHMGRRGCKQIKGGHPRRLARDSFLWRFMARYKATGVRSEMEQRETTRGKTVRGASHLEVQITPLPTPREESGPWTQTLWTINDKCRKRHILPVVHWHTKDDPATPRNSYFGGLETFPFCAHVCFTAV